MRQTACRVRSTSLLDRPERFVRLWSGRIWWDIPLRCNKWESRHGRAPSGSCPMLRQSRGRSSKFSALPSITCTYYTGSRRTKGELMETVRIYRLTGLRPRYRARLRAAQREAAKGLDAVPREESPDPLPLQRQALLPAAVAGAGGEPRAWPDPSCRWGVGGPRSSFVLTYLSRVGHASWCGRTAMSCMSRLRLPLRKSLSASPRPRWT